MYRDLIHLTKFIPYTRFHALNKVKHIIKDPVLDLGCHIGDTFWYMKFNGDITGIDIYEPYFKKCRERKIYNKLIKLNLNDLPENYGKYGCVTAFFVLEHMPKEDGLRLLAKLDNYSENTVLLTPDGISEQESPDENAYRSHISSWYPKDFTSRGYTVSKCIQLSIKKIRQFPYRIILATKKGARS